MTEALEGPEEQELTIYIPLPTQFCPRVSLNLSLAASGLDTFLVTSGSGQLRLHKRLNSLQNGEGDQVVTLPKSLKNKAGGFDSSSSKKKKYPRSSERITGLSLIETGGLITGRVPLFALAVRKLRRKFASHQENLSAAFVPCTSAY